ncbi:MAG: glycosyltransferase family 1 protein [Bacteroidetes bacterium]|nr:MAG: glycosyltransferase family 1 protein [Bacteroidota bacterium]
MKKIFINGRFLSQDITGVQRYAIELIKLLDDFIEKKHIDKNKFEIIIITPKKIIHDISLKNIKTISFGILDGHLWEQFILPFKVRTSNLVNLCNSAPVFNLIFGKTITVVHDVGFYFLPETYSKNFVRWYRFLTPIIFKFSKKIITVSEAEKKRLISYFKKPNLRIEAIQNGGISMDFKKEFHQILPIENRQKVFLYVGSLNAKKNYHGVLKAYEIFCEKNNDYTLKIIGSTHNVFGNFQVNIKESTLNRIEFLGRVDDKTLFEWYNCSSCFLFPSFYESSPFPPIEAMEMGCPVILSDIESHRERAGNAAIFCNPNDNNDIANKMLEIANSTLLQKNLQKLGLEQVKIFSWENCAKKTWDVLSK